MWMGESWHCGLLHSSGLRLPLLKSLCLLSENTGQTGLWGRKPVAYVQKSDLLLNIKQYSFHLYSKYLEASFKWENAGWLKSGRMVYPPT